MDLEEYCNNLNLETPIESLELCRGLLENPSLFLFILIYLKYQKIVDS